MTNSAAFLSQHSDSLQAISRVGDRTLSLFHKLSPEAPAGRRPEHKAILFDFVGIGETTGKAVSSLLSSGMVLPALALARVRLEQLIVTSYLVHEVEDLGLRPYTAYAPIADYRMMKSVLAEPALAPHVQHRVQFDDLQNKAFAAQLEINPGFEIVGGQFQTKWTKLDLYAMALKRDKLSAESKFLSRLFSLVALYTSFYKAGSCVVHADGSILVKPFSGLLKSDDGTMEIDTDTFWQVPHSANPRAL